MNTDEFLEEVCRTLHGYTRCDGNGFYAAITLRAEKEITSLLLCNHLY